MRKPISILLVAGLAVSGFADVSVVSNVTSGGYQGWGGSKGTQVEMVQGGLRSRHDIASKMTGAVLGNITHDADTATLTLLDEDVIRMLNLRKKTYTEQSLAELREAMKRAMAQQDAQESKPQKESAPTHRISRAEFKVNATGASKTINGFPCKEYVLTLLLEIEDLKTHEKGQTRMISTLWNTPETAALKQVRQEQAAFAQAYLKKMDVAISPRDLSAFGAQMAAALTGAGQDELSRALAKVPAEMKKLSGYPISTQVDWYMDQDQAARAKQETSTDAEPADAIDTSSVGGALGSMAGHWAKKMATQQVAEKQKAHADKPLISILTEIQSVSTDKLPASDFSIPAGFKKIEQKK
jgi:hypothetical protein